LHKHIATLLANQFYPLSTALPNNQIQDLPKLQIAYEKQGLVSVAGQKNLRNKNTKQEAKTK